MGIQAEWVRYGRDAAEALRARIASAKGAEPLAAVTVVVPSNHVGVATRRLLAGGSLGPVCSLGVGLAAVTFVTPYRLAELLGAARLASTGRRPVSTPIIAAAFRAALGEAPGLFCSVASHPATETALITSYRELRDLSADALDALAATSERAGDVVRLCRSVRARLEPAWYDEEDLMSSAAVVLRDQPTAGISLGALVVYLPQRLSRHAAALIRAAASDRDLLVLAGATGDPRADAEVFAALARLGLGDPPTPHIDPMGIVAPDRTRIVTTSDADDEVRGAVRAVVDATRAGVPLDRIAILHASPQPYARLVHEQLAAAGIAANGASVIPLAGRVAGRTLLDFLALPEGGFRRGEIFAWLAGAPILDRGRPVPTTAWERLSRDAAVVAGRGQWDELLTVFAAGQRAEADRVDADPDEPSWRAERLRGDARRAEALRRFALGVIDELAAAAARPRPWAQHAQWAQRLLNNYLGGTARRDQWPVSERKAAERVERAIDRLRALDTVEGAVTLEVFGRTLQLELDSDLGRVGRFGEGVLVGTVGMGVGLDLDLVIVLGLAEGSFPSAVRDDSLLPDHEREVTGDQLPLRSHRVEREHRELLAALAGAARQLLCVPRGDLRRSRERVPSRWVLEVASAVAGQRWWAEDLHRAATPWVGHVASFDAGLRAVGFPATAQEHRLCSLLAAEPARPGMPLLTAPDALTARGAAVIAARRSDRFTRFDGNLAGLALPSPAERLTSPTRLERWAACPFAYLLQDVLRVEAVENPEEQLRMSKLDLGSLVHSALERFIAEVLDRPDAQQPAPDQAWNTDDWARMEAIAAEVFAEYERRGLTGRPIFWRRDRALILDGLHQFLNHDSAQRRAHRTRPLAAELAFGTRDAKIEAVAVALPDGRAVRFRGKADRVDIAADGMLHVVDYKTGSSGPYTGLSNDDPDLRGRRLQLAVYGQAARLQRNDPDAPVRAEYWFVSAKYGFKRIGYAVTPEVLDKVSATLATIVAGIEAGVFPPRPTSTSTNPYIECRYCDPDGLGVAELRNRFDHKRLDPAVAIFADLAEPLADIAVDTETGPANA